jgi:hypothetical protein
MNRLDHDASARIFRPWREGNSIRAVIRLTGASKKAVSGVMVECEAAKPKPENAHALLHAADECVLKENRNHAHPVALFAMYYNFVHIHKTLRTTSAMAAGVTKRLWEIADIFEGLEAWERLSGEHYAAA